MESGALSSNAEAIAWICFILGALVLVVGLYIGIISAPKKAEEENQKKLDEAKKTAAETTSQLKTLTTPGALESGDAAGVAADATEKAEKTESLLDGIGSLVGSLPEHQRFPGMLVLVGAVLMSVGTIQFGGTSIF
jgi:hypothetical protein